MKNAKNNKIRVVVEFTEDELAEIILQASRLDMTVGELLSHRIVEEASKLSV